VDAGDKLERVPEILVGEGHEQDEAVEVEREAARDRLIVCRDDVVIVLDGLEVPKTVWDREAASDDRASADCALCRTGGRSAGPRALVPE
jgi:hypothetical protein